MNRRYSTIAVSALALGAAAFTATEASAQLPPEPGSGYTTPEYNYPEYKLEVPASPTDRIQEPVDDAWVGALPAGASALGGAGVALGGLWLYRRRHVPAT